jgi:two-component system sensor histidine kinase BaeS
VIVDFEDSAPGVPAEALPRLFERFYRVEGSRSRANGGAGLGLAIVRSVVEAHGGAIEAGASPLGGLRVTISLP